ncbi:membrane-anchored mycosin MYCP [Nocardioides cavernae]|uniref:Membrane-anchored mycosin MYCP n=1 Tax=Nocardioides cavernae TaxID=1921566 RepID=A0A7Y9H173_9ACTN|nr:S8 family serine peptidase [Nocardioides cavernae]NYE36094.1 membrane-anchored mycosin MYCP [Nocardioides cavernae]
MAPARLRTSVAAGVLAAAVVPVWAGPAVADHAAPCLTSEVPGSEQLADTHTEDNIAFDRMHVEQAQELATGKGTKIAVIDSGVVPVDGLRRVGGVAIDGVTQTFLSGHGTIVASLIAGPRGVAPDAEVFDVKVFDAEDADPSQGERKLSSAGIVAGIEQVIALQPQQRFDVVNISLAVTEPDPALEAAVARLVALDGVVVVAAAGNAETDGGSDVGPGGTPDNDADVFPADYPGVLGVSATPPGDENPSTYVVPNKQTDVAAPTLGAISANATGQVCEIDQVATSWAAAEVSGIIALLREQFPRETPEQLVARLQATTEGMGVREDDDAVRNPWNGAGVVQAYDALTRQIKPGRQGRLDATVPETRLDAQAPPAPRQVDLFTTPRAMLLWSGLVAGSLLALAVMLRPLVRRPRPPRT